MADDILKRAAPFVPIVQEFAQKYSVPQELMLGILAQESRFNPVAVGPQTRYGTAKGIAQFIDDTAKRFGVDPFNPRSAIEGQAKYLQQLGQMFNNDPKLMAAAYNAGEGNVKKANGVPNFPETQNYVNKVLSFMPLFSSQGLAKTVTPEQATQTPNNLLAGLDPSALLPQQSPTLSGPLRTLLTTLATIGGLGGTAANVISAVKGNPATGNEAIRQSGALFQEIQKDKLLQQQQEDAARLANTPGLNPLLQTLAAIGGREALAPVALSAAKEALPANQLAIKKAQQDYEQDTPAGRAQLRKEKLDDAIALAKGTQQFKGVGEARAETTIASNLRGEMNRLPEVRSAREVMSQFARVDNVYQNYLKNPEASRPNVDQALIFSLNKMLDPGSAVREGEYARSEEGIALASKLSNYAEKLRKGGVNITDADRADIYNTMKLLHDGHLRAIQPTLDFYQKEAVRSGVDPERVINLKLPAEEAKATTRLDEIKAGRIKREDIAPQDLKSLSLEELEALANGN